MDYLSRFQMNGLRALSALNCHGTLNKAATQLCVSPGAVSKQVTRIEEQFGYRIFERTADGFVPIAGRKKFLAELSAGFEQIDAALSLLDEQKSDQLRVTVAPGLAKCWLISRLGNFSKNHKNVRLTIDSSQSLADLRLDQYSCAIRYGSGIWSHLKASKLMEFKLFPVCAPGLLSKLSHIRDLEDVPVIMENNAPTRWQRWLTVAGHKDICLLEGPVMSSPDLCVDAAISGMGVALVWQTMAVDALNAGHLAVPFPIIVNTGEAYWLVESEFGIRSAATRQFQRWLESEFRLSQIQLKAFTTLRVNEDGAAHHYV